MVYVYTILSDDVQSAWSVDVLVRERFMSRMVTIAIATSMMAVFATVVLVAQEPLDGPKRIFHDELLDHLVGHWVIARDIRGTRTQNTADVDWVLNHQFLHIRMRDTAIPPQYGAEIFIGYDNRSDRYVVHWLDTFGGRFSETLAYGRRSGTSITFVFEYPDAPFHNTFTWDAAASAWTSRMEQRDASGQWVTFANDTFRRAR
jgi:hypothetical protein